VSVGLAGTLEELFDTFFPGKSFGGVSPQDDGSVEFPVRLSTGHIHDINDLSSGEKEVLYGYLRLRSTAPRHSIVLIDEPELHLNPALLQGLPDFYYKHVAQGLRNQLWLVTHSDTLLRQAVGHNNYSVYHMQLAAVSDGRNQAQRVDARTDLERATIDLVGDLATYIPNAKVVLLEGADSGGFDVHMVSRLFPVARVLVNFVAGGSRRRVSDLWGVLDHAVREGGIPAGVFAIVDRDSGAVVEEAPSVFSWDVYHIENYLLEPRFVLQACNALAPSSGLVDVAAVDSALKEAARQTFDELQELIGGVVSRVAGRVGGAVPAEPD
jgi:hypothetical protein